MLVFGLLFFCVLIVLILVHEFGHFIVAKAFDIKVEEFSIFFPPRLFSKQFGETMYTINALPFGGFVKMLGESVDESNPSAQVDPRSFVGKPRYIQAAVVVAGISFNLIFAWLLLSGGYMVGMETSVQHLGVGVVQDAHVTIVSVLPGSPADRAGIKPEDKVLTLQTAKETLTTATLTASSRADVVQNFIISHAEESVILGVERGGEKKYLLAKAVEGLVPGHKAIGVTLDDVGMLKLSPPLALVEGAILAKEITVETAKGLLHFFGQIVVGHPNFSGVSGPIGIVRVGSTIIQEGWMRALLLTAAISINLAVLNTLPVPGLDGGRLLFIGIEAVIRRPIREKVAIRFTILGFALLALLMLVASYHDIINIVHGV